jgi:hypothetical protein
VDHVEYSIGALAFDRNGADTALSFMHLHIGESRAGQPFQPSAWLERWIGETDGQLAATFQDPPDLS